VKPVMQSTTRNLGGLDDEFAWWLIGAADACVASSWSSERASLSIRSARWMAAYV